MNFKPLSAQSRKAMSHDSELVFDICSCFVADGGFLSVSNKTGQSGDSVDHFGWVVTVTSRRGNQV